MVAAIQLGRPRIDSILMVDRADDLGGTRHLNTYPGIAVDIASVAHPYSFESELPLGAPIAPAAELKA